MADQLQFQEPQYARPEAASGQTGITGLVIRLGLATDGRQASKILLITAIVGLGAAAIPFFLHWGAPQRAIDFSAQDTLPAPVPH